MKKHSTSNPLDDLLGRASDLAKRKQGEAVVYLGSVQDPIPRLLVEDSDIPATAFRIWAHLRSRINNPNAPGMVPSYPNIMNILGIGSRGTVSSAFLMLRMTRWITLVSRESNDRGYKVGNVYALHSEPLSIEDTLSLDQEYMRLLEDAAVLDISTSSNKSRNKKTKDLALRVLDGIAVLYGQRSDTAHYDMKQRLIAHRARSLVEQESVEGTEFFGRNRPIETENVAEEDNRKSLSTKIVLRDSEQNSEEKSLSTKIVLRDFLGTKLGGPPWATPQNHELSTEIDELSTA